jgi:hypothetical protein
MTKNNAAKGQHGIGARGQGKLLFFHTRITQAIRHSKDQMFRKRRQAHGFRQSNGHWVA